MRCGYALAAYTREWMCTEEWLFSAALLKRLIRLAAQTSKAGDDQVAAAQTAAVGAAMFQRAVQQQLIGQEAAAGLAAFLVDTFDLAWPDARGSAFGPRTYDLLAPQVGCTPAKFTYCSELLSKIISTCLSTAVDTGKLCNLQHPGQC